ncbi:hypothetical protein Dimus_029012 [Dionaea muscipula]
MAITPFSICVLILLLASSVTLSSSQSLSPPPQSTPPSSPEYHRGSCSSNLVAFSSCLSYVSSPPNNASSSPASTCCRFYSATVDAGDAKCLCYLLRDPSMLGFPVNVTRVLSLSSVCPRRRRHRSSNSSLESICSGLKTLSPLQSPGAGFLNHSNAGAQASHPVTSAGPKSPDSAPPSLPLEPSDGFTDVSIARKTRGASIWWFLGRGVLVLSLFQFQLSHFPEACLTQVHRSMSGF